MRCFFYFVMESTLPSKSRNVSTALKPYLRSSVSIPKTESNLSLPDKFSTSTVIHTSISMAVVELMVGMHCQRCIKAIKKAIKKIEDIETYKLDATQNKITVTGNVTTEEVFRVLQKIGKNPRYWNEVRGQELDQD